MTALDRPFPSRQACRGYARRTLLDSADRFDEASQHETAAMLRYAASDLSDMDAIARRREQNTYLYDQWGIRIAHCPKTEPHEWHGWTHLEDLRCPGVAEVRP